MVELGPADGADEAVAVGMALDVGVGVCARAEATVSDTPMDARSITPTMAPNGLATKAPPSVLRRQHYALVSCSSTPNFKYNEQVDRA